jgi:hypothetical protein
VSRPDEWSTFPANPVRSTLYEETPSLARAALIEFAQRQPPTAADVDQVMRALAVHERWLVPVEYARQAWGQSAFDQLIPFADRGPLAMLNVFTDGEAAALGAAEVSGDYGGPVTGAQLLQYLDPGLSALIVNPGSPREHQWYIASGGFDIAAGWATALVVERALANRGNGPAPAADLLAHRYQLLIDKETGGPAQVVLPEIDGVFAVCFTAADRTSEFVAGLPIPARPLADVAPIDGRQLFETVRSMGAAGLVVNAGSDDQTALTEDDLAEVIQARAARQ